MQKRKNRIEQWRAERRAMLGIDKVIQQSVSQTAKVQRILFTNSSYGTMYVSYLKGKAWSLEDEGDEDEDDPQNVVIPSTDLKREVASARETAISLQNDKQREAMERAAQAAAIAAAACANTNKTENDDDEEDPLEKYMEGIAKEVKSVRGNNATIISKKPNGNTTTIKQEPSANTSKGSVIKIITKTIKNEVRLEIHLFL